MAMYKYKLKKNGVMPRRGMGVEIDTPIHVVKGFEVMPRRGMGVEIRSRM